MPSLLEQSRRDRGRLTDHQHVAAIVSDLIAEFGLSPPVPLEVVASIQDIGAVIPADLEDCAGCLVPGPDSWTIQVRASDSPGRQRFTGFHEVGHTFMPGFEHRKHHRCHPSSRLFPDSRAIEALCDTAAVEFLLPARSFRSDLESAEFSFDAADELAVRYDSSREAAARRLVALWPEPAFFMILTYRNKLRESQSGAAAKLRVEHYVPAGPTWRAMPKLKSLADEDPLNIALHDGRFQGLSPLGGLQPSHHRTFCVDARRSEWPDTDTGELKPRVLLIARSTGTPR